MLQLEAIPSQRQELDNVLKLTGMTIPTRGVDPLLSLEFMPSKFPPEVVQIALHLDRSQKRFGC
jgi:hypothetical protein